MNFLECLTTEQKIIILLLAILFISNDVKNEDKILFARILNFTTQTLFLSTGLDAREEQQKRETQELCDLKKQIRQNQERINEICKTKC